MAARERRLRNELIKLKIMSNAQGRKDAMQVELCTEALGGVGELESLHHVIFH